MRLAVEREPASGEIACGCRRRPSPALGALSRGTMEQRFFALRLGFALERGGAEPLPLILDDVLVNFDTKRQRAAIVTLGEVAKKTQVLFLLPRARGGRCPRDSRGGARCLECGLRERLWIFMTSTSASAAAGR